MRSTFLVSLLFGFTFFLFSSCNQDNQEEIDQELIQAYLQDNNLVAEATLSGLHYIIHTPGNNEHPTQEDFILISYEGRLLNGNLFDENSNISFRLGDLIQGWREGIPLIGKGGSITLIIPSHLGYGSSSQAGIPANSVLIFEIELFDF